MAFLTQLYPFFFTARDIIQFSLHLTSVFIIQEFITIFGEKLGDDFTQRLQNEFPLFLAEFLGGSVFSEHIVFQFIVYANDFSPVYILFLDIFAVLNLFNERRKGRWSTNTLFFEELNQFCFGVVVFSIYQGNYRGNLFVFKHRPWFDL